MTITADSGSTKTTWKITDGSISWTLSTQGINPFHQSPEFMSDVISHELLTQDAFPSANDITEIYFYGSGCTKEKSPILKDLLQTYFPQASHIEVDSDMLGAAKALFGDTEGIACILGTGANSCLYDGNRIVSNVSPMGYILGDEGSGAVLGKTFVNLLYKGGCYDDDVRSSSAGSTFSVENDDDDYKPGHLPNRHDIEDFENETGLTQTDIIHKVYREPMPNRFLASLCYYLFRHISTPWIHDMVIDSFRLFFQRNVSHYNRRDLPCSFVGSVAFYLEKELREAAQQEGYIIGKILKEPLA